jgi:hypothetical protein
VVVIEEFTSYVSSMWCNIFPVNTTRLQGARRNCVTSLKNTLMHVQDASIVQMISVGSINRDIPLPEIPCGP